MNMTTCPKCKMRVLPKADGTCPSCQAVISPNKIANTAKAALAKNEKASTPLKQKSPAMTKDISSNRTADKREVSKNQIKTEDASNPGKEVEQPVEHVPSKLESRYDYAMHKTVDFAFILIVLVIVGSWIIKRTLNFDVILRFGLLGLALLFIVLMIFGKPKKEKS
jgi:hypothetical protein